MSAGVYARARVLACSRTCVRVLVRVFVRVKAEAAELAAAVAHKNQKLDELASQVLQLQAHVALLKNELSNEYKDKIYLLAAAQGQGQSAASPSKASQHREQGVKEGWR